MKKIIFVLGIALYLCAPNFGHAAAAPRTFTGTVTRITGNQIMFIAASAAKYTADSGHAQLLRKNGMAMQFAEIIVGDKVEVKGQLWPDNSISATSIRNLSLYTHKGTFSGKIISINLLSSSFVIQSKLNGSQTIHTNNFTSFTKNGGSSTFMDLQLGMTMSLKGLWDRYTSDVVGTIISGSYRLVDIYFTGTLTMKGDAGFTVLANGNVIYGVDISNTLLQNKVGLTLPFSAFNAGDILRVWGKHLSASSQVVASKIKNTTR